MGKKSLNSDEYDKVLRKLSELNSELEIHKAKLSVIRTDLENLRGRFNQRLAKIGADENKEPPKEINSGEAVYV